MKTYFELELTAALGVLCTLGIIKGLNDLWNNKQDWCVMYFLQLPSSEFHYSWTNFYTYLWTSENARSSPVFFLKRNTEIMKMLIYYYDLVNTYSYQQNKKKEVLKTPNLCPGFPWFCIMMTFLHETVAKHQNSSGNRITLCITEDWLWSPSNQTRHKEHWRSSQVAEGNMKL
jgi:hypothetical protein